jgi:hypothetical protein
MTDPRLLALSSNPGQVEPGPFSEHDLREQWNAQANEFNQWESLDSSEQLAWAQARAIAADRNGRPAAPPAPEVWDRPSLADVDELCAEFGFHYDDTQGESLEILQQMVAAAITRWHAPVAQPAAQPVNLAELRDPDFSDGLTASQHLDVLRGGPDPRAAAAASPGLPPRVGHILTLAAIIRKVDGKHDLGAAALAEAILAHPEFGGCHDGPVAPPAQGEPSESEQPIEWVVNSLGELGVCSNGRYYFLYKGRSIEYDGNCEDADAIMVRPVGKREFGEVCKPIGCLKVENGILYDRTPYPYLEELIYNPGLSDPGDYSWRPLPSRPPAKGKAGNGAAVQGEVGELVAALEADAKCIAAEQPDLMQLTDKQLIRIAQLLKGLPNA